MKSLFVAMALLLSASLAAAQEKEPAQKPAAVKAAKSKPKPPAVQAAKPAEGRPGTLEIVQVFGIKQIDAATYEIDARLKNGEPINLRANAFVLQALGKMLGTFGR